MKHDNPAIRTHEDAAAWVKRALEYSGMSGAEIARALTERGLMSGGQRGIVSKLTAAESTTGKPRILRAAEMCAISEVTGYPIPSQKNEDEIEQLAKELRGIPEPQRTSIINGIKFALRVSLSTSP